MGAVGHSFTC